MYKKTEAIHISILLFFFVISSNVQGQSITEKLKSNSQTTQFAQALEKTGVSARFSEDGPFTLFVPTNSAFNRLSSGQQSNANLLLNHILTGMATERNLRAMSDIISLSGMRISIQNQSENKLSVQNNQIITTNIKARNGVIHIIDGVIE